MNYFLYKKFGFTFLIWLIPTVFLLPKKDFEGRIIYVSNNGNDAHKGTFQEPIRTISSAARRAQPGDVVMVLEGTYRERVAPKRGGLAGQPITYKGEPGKRVFVKGSEIWEPDWKIEEEGIYSAQPNESLFNDRSREYKDHHNPFKVELASTPFQREGIPEEKRRKAGDHRMEPESEKISYTCGQIFVDGKPYLEVPLREEMTFGKWWYDKKRERIFICFGELNPWDLMVEITTRRRIFAPEIKGLGYINLEGFIFEHCGNQYPTDFWRVDENAQKGAVGTEAGHHWTIRRNVIRYCKTFALDCGRVDRHSMTFSTSHNNLIEQNYILDNGSAGILSYGSRNLILRGNVILRNNYLGFSGIKRWEQGGIKCHKLENGLIEKNYIAYNQKSPGIWLDNEFPDSRINRNVIHDNGTHGIFIEMSDYKYDRLLINENLIFSNRENAVYIHDASGATFANNLLAHDEKNSDIGQIVHIRQVSNRGKTQNHSFYNNLFISESTGLNVNYPDYRSGLQRFDFNLYGFAHEQRNFYINAKSEQPAPWDKESFQSQILNDLGLKQAPLAFVRKKDTPSLNFKEWQQFWKSHKQINDANSNLIAGMQMTYQPETFSLSFELLTHPEKLTEKKPKPADRDYFSEVKTKFRRFPAGPFRNPLKSTNNFIIWEGLPLISKSCLPDSDWTSESNNSMAN